MMKKILLGLLLVVSFEGFSQNGWNWGEDKIAATRKYQYLTTYMQSKRYQQCREATNWLLVNAPDLNVDLYKRASVVYKECAKTSKGDDLIVVQDSALLVYDLWDARFGTEKNRTSILNKKAKIYYKYTKDRTDLDTLARFYKSTLITNKGKTYTKNVEYYLTIALKQKAAGSITTDQLFDAYNLCIATTSARRKYKANKASEIKRIDKTEAWLLKQMMSSVKMNCEEVETYFSPKIEANPTDVALADAARKFLDQNECRDTELYLKTVRIVTESNPSVERYIYLAGLERNKKRTQKALACYEKALALTADPAKKSEVLYELALLYSGFGQKVKARIEASKVIATGYNQAKAYALIGNLYYNSASDCDNKDELIKRSIYIAAYLQYEKAGDIKKMDLAKQQFPSMEDIFVKSKKVGDIVNTGCWINENVPLKKR